MRVIWGVLRLGLMTRFVYRMEVLTAVISALLVVILSASVWGAVVEGRADFAGLRPPQVTTYVVVAWMVTSITGSRIDAFLGNRFRNGQIASDLTRPLDVQLFVTVRQVGRALASVALTGVPVMAIATVLFPVMWPRSGWTWLIVSVSIFLAVIIGSQIGFLVGLASFRLKRITGLTHLKTVGVALLSGAVVPLDALPYGLRQGVMFLPFQTLGHTPTVLFLERTSTGEALALLCVQCIWAGLLVLAGHLIWRRAMYTLTVQGG